MTRIVPLVFFLFHFSFIQAQLVNTSQEDAIEIKKRILLVALPEEDKYIVSEKTDFPFFIKAYREDMEGQQKAFQEIVLRYWKYNDSIVVTSLKEAKSLMKKNPGTYALLRYSEKTEDRIYVNTHDTIPIVAWVKSGNNNFTYNIGARYDFRMLTVNSLTIELPKRVIQVFLPKLSPSKGDFIYAIRQLDYILTNVSLSEGRTSKDIYKEMPQLAEELKTITLLLDINEMSNQEGLRNIGTIKQYYPYPVQLVGYNDIEKVLLSGDTRYAVVTQCRYDFHNSTFCISNAGNGKLYNDFMGPTFDYGNTVDATHYTLRIYYPSINKLNLERYVTGK